MWWEIQRNWLWGGGCIPQYLCLVSMIHNIFVWYPWCRMFVSRSVSDVMYCGSNWLKLVTKWKHWFTSHIHVTKQVTTTLQVSDTPTPTKQVTTTLRVSDPPTPTKQVTTTLQGSDPPSELHINFGGDQWKSVISMPYNTHTPTDQIICIDKMCGNLEYNDFNLPYLFCSQLLKFIIWFNFYWSSFILLLFC